MLKVRYYCYFGALTGYGRAAHDYMMALLQHGGVELEIWPAGRDLSTSLEPRYTVLQKYAMQRSARPADVSIFHATPRVLSEMLPPRSQQEGVLGTTVALTTWETSTMPVAHLEGLGIRYDHVITPSEFCADMMQPLKAYVVPHAFDPNFWTPGGELHADPYTFYTIGAWGARKNNLGLLRAYFHAFDRSDNVNLVMVVPPGTRMDPIRSLIVRTGIPEDKLPGLTVVNEPLSEAQLRDLHRGGACYVSATRGEGWGLGLFEAAIMGKQVVTPTWGGQADFLEDLFADLPIFGDGEYERLYGVRARVTPAFPDELISHVEKGGDGKLLAVSVIEKAGGIDCKQLWADPDLEHLATQMCNAVSDFRNGRVHDVEASQRCLAERFSYAAVGAQLTELLERIAR